MPALRSSLLLILLTCHGAMAGAAPVRVATSVAPITDIVQQVAGKLAVVTGLIPEGLNSHTFAPPPSSAKLLVSADLILVNGLDLELPLIELAHGVKRSNTPMVELGIHALDADRWRYDFSFPRKAGHPNPHLWPNPMLAARYAEIARDMLSAIDPSNQLAYQQNSAAYVARLTALDRAISACVASIPAPNRKLVTYHDSYAYFAPRYGMTVVGALQPADFAEPSAREVARMIDQIRRERVPAIFGSAVFPSPVLATIAREAGARYVDKLRDDDLPGDPGDPGHSYIGMMIENLRVMSDALGGDTGCMDGVEP